IISRSALKSAASRAMHLFYARQTPDKQKPYRRIRHGFSFNSLRTVFLYEAGRFLRTPSVSLIPAKANAALPYAKYKENVTSAKVRSNSLSHKATESRLYLGT